MSSVADQLRTAREARYICDGMRVIQERNISNTPTVSYTRGNDLSGTMEGAGGIGGMLARSHGYSSGNWSTHNFYHADGNGNVTFMLNSSQAMVARYRYDPFGNTISSSGSLADANLYRFSSKMFDTFSGLYYYGYRWYDPNLQRWLNRDPIAELGFQKLRGTTLKSDLTENWHGSVMASTILSFLQGQGDVTMSATLDEANLYAYVLNSPITRIDPYGLIAPYPCVSFPWCPGPITLACVISCAFAHGTIGYCVTRICEAPPPIFVMIYHDCYCCTGTFPPRPR